MLKVIALGYYQDKKNRQTMQTMHLYFGTGHEACGRLRQQRPEVSSHRTSHGEGAVDHCVSLNKKASRKGFHP